MQTLGAYLIYAAVLLRTVVVVSDEPSFPIVLALLGAYGLLLIGETWLQGRKPTHHLPLREIQLAYLCLQSVLVIGAMILSSYEDFLAMLFLPLSLTAVAFFGRRIGFLSIGIFSLAMTLTLLFSDVGSVFGIVMGILYSGICVLVGGYAYQVQNAKAARDQNEQLFGELQTAHRQLQAYANQMEHLAVEQERNRLARELHDSVTQTVFSMNLAAQSAHLLWEKEPRRAVDQFLHIEELAASAMGEIQSLVSQLSPRSPVDAGLAASLRRLAAEQRTRNGLDVTLEIHGEKAFSQAVTTGLYAIAQEALINVAKHSGVDEATIRLDVAGPHPCLEMEDHGRGFRPEAALSQRGHLGLAGMSERAREIGWELSVLSSPGQGTRILVRETPSGGSG